jgi:hypothetical protein
MIFSIFRSSSQALSRVNLTKSISSLSSGALNGFFIQTSTEVFSHFCCDVGDGVFCLAFAAWNK